MVEMAVSFNTIHTNKINILGPRLGSVEALAQPCNQYLNIQQPFGSD